MASSREGARTPGPRRPAGMRISEKLAASLAVQVAIVLGLCWAGSAHAHLLHQSPSEQRSRALGLSGVRTRDTHGGGGLSLPRPLLLTGLSHPSWNLAGGREWERQLRQVRRASPRVRRPCSRTAAQVHVYAEGDFRKRWAYKASKSVVVYVHQSLTLRTGLVLGANFSCTILRPAPGLASVNLTYPDSRMPVLTVFGTHNVWVSGISIRRGIDASAQPCAFGLFGPGRESSQLVCPAVYIARCWAVQLTQASVYGRIDVFRAIHVLLDHLKVTGPPVYNAKSEYTGYGVHGFIRMGETSLGPQFKSSHNVISNCEVYGGWELITLYRGAVGVTVTRNYLHDFLFAGERCGADVAYVMDCHHNTISYNYIYNPPAYSSSVTDVNNAGIYTCLHFFNPGNYITCNYIYNQRWCYYLDFTSSGATIEGGMCNGSYAAVKVNGGKYNKVRSLIVVQSSKFLHFTSCVSVTFSHCLHPTGNNWEAVRRQFYDTPSINAKYPYMRSICNPIPSIINSLPCNPPEAKYNSSVTGYCSGYSYGNDVQSFWYYRSGPRIPYDVNTCKDDTGVDTTAFNLQAAYDVTANPGFVGGGRAPNLRDFGLQRTSRIYALYPKFKSCPRGKVGPVKFSASRASKYYRSYWNLPRPPTFNDVISLDFKNIFSPKLSVPLSDFKISSKSTTVP